MGSEEITFYHGENENRLLVGFWLIQI